MAKDMSTDSAAGHGRIRDLWGAIAQRWPRRLRLRRPRVTRLRLAVLAVVAVLLLLWGAVAVASTSIYSAQVLVVEGGSVGIPPPNDLDFGDLPVAGGSQKKIVFENNGRVPTGVMILEWGGIRDLMKISDAFFTLDPGDEREITFTVEPPPSSLPEGAAEKGYSGKVVVIRAPWWWPW